MLEIFATCLVLTALLAYLNHRYIGLPTTIGVMVIALVLSLAIVALSALGLDLGLRQYEESLVKSIDFQYVLMQGLLSLLLFAGALHVDISELRARRWEVGGLALIGTAASAAIVGFGMWFVLPWLGIELPLVHCLLFGALISPTDPVAVMGIVKQAGAPKELELVIAGESLFNDGVGVVLFGLLLQMLYSGVAPSVGAAGHLLLMEAGGGIVFGLALGYGTYVLLRSVDNYQVEVMLTLAAVVGGSALAWRLGVSAPLAMVVAGILIGNHGRALGMSDTTRRYVDMFWELIDEILNAVLFVLIGMEVLLVKFSVTLGVAAIVAIAATLAARWIAVGLPFDALGRRTGLPRGSARVLVWGGLRGGISVALALSLPEGPHREVVLALTYGVVVFSILVQGLTIGRVVRRALHSPVRDETPTVLPR